MKKDQNLLNKNFHSNSSSGKTFPNNSNYSRNQSSYNSIYIDSQNKEIHKIFHKLYIADQIVETTIHDQIHIDKIREHTSLFILRARFRFLEI